MVWHIDRGESIWYRLDCDHECYFRKLGKPQSLEHIYNSHEKYQSMLQMWMQRLTLLPKGQANAAYCYALLPLDKPVQHNLPEVSTICRKLMFDGVCLPYGMWTGLPASSYNNHYVV